MKAVGLRVAIVDQLLVELQIAVRVWTEPSPEVDSEIMSLAGEHDDYNTAFFAGAQRGTALERCTDLLRFPDQLPLPMPTQGESSAECWQRKQETASRLQENKKQVILRNQIEEIQSTGKSMMPEGLEKETTAQDIADLIAYIRRPATSAQ